MTKEKSKSLVDHYMSLKYTAKVKEIEEGGYFAEVAELPGCMCDAETLDELFRKLEETKRFWIESTLSRDGEVPLPEEDPIYSGRFVVRMPKSLHKTLSKRAKKEGTSLNSYVNTLLAANSEHYNIANLLTDQSKLQTRVMLYTHRALFKKPEHGSRNLNDQFSKGEFGARAP